jgi:PAS domain S-box-containing protein
VERQARDPSDFTAVEQSALLHALYEVGPDGVLCVDGEGFIIQLNAKAGELFGYEPSELVGRPIESLIPERFRIDHSELRRRFTAERQARPMGVGLNIVGKRKDGSEFPAAVNLSPQVSRGRVFVAAIVTDITEMKRAEEQLRDSEERYRKLIELSPDAYVVVVGERVAFMNSAGLSLFGAETATDIIGRPVWDFIDMDSLPQLSQMVRDLRERGARVQSTGQRFRRLDGRIVEVEIAMVPTRFGNADAVELIARDIGERKRAEELQIRALAAEESERLKTNLLSFVSHELRTPLTAIRGFATTILEYFDRLPLNDIIDFIRALDESAQQLERIVGDLLTLSRIESGVIRMEMERLDIVDLLRRFIEGRRVAEPELQIRLDTSEPEIVVSADATRIVQVLNNLLDNAATHGDRARPINVTATVEDGTCRISVRDRGPGVPEEVLETIFVPYYRVSAGTATPRISSREQGSGLGLAICKGIITAHGGEIAAELAPGGGLLVWFTLSLASS